MSLQDKLQAGVDLHEADKKRKVSDSIKWELLEYTNSQSSHRLWVPGGWLVRTTSHAYAESAGKDPAISISTAMIFVDDPKHLWSVDAKPYGEVR